MWFGSCGIPIRSSLGPERISSCAVLMFSSYSFVSLASPFSKAVAATCDLVRCSERLTGGSEDGFYWRSDRYYCLLDNRKSVSHRERIFFFVEHKLTTHPLENSIQISNHNIE